LPLLHITTLASGVIHITLTLVSVTACRVDNVSRLRYNSNYNQLTKEEQIMTIEYSLWDGAQLLGVGFTATSADEMNKVVADLQKVSTNVVAHMRKVSM
jgi:hypothetical protein